MPATKGNKLTKGEKVDNYKQYKTITVTRNGEAEKAEKSVPGNENSHCVDCGKPKAVLKSQAGLTCDAWLLVPH